MTQGFNLTAKQAALRDQMAGPKKHALIYGGSRCVSGDTILDGHTMAISEMAVANLPVMVKSSHGYQMAEAPFRKGASEMLIVTTENGSRVEVTDDHRFWDGNSWIKAKEVSKNSLIAVARSSWLYPLASNSAPYLSGFRPGALGLTGTLQDCLGDCFSHFRQHGAQLPRQECPCPVCCASQSDDPAHIREHHRAEAHGSNIHMAQRNQLGVASIQTGPQLSHQTKMGAIPSPDLPIQSLSHSCEQTCELSLETPPRHQQSVLMFAPQESSSQGQDTCVCQSGQSFVVSDIPCKYGYALDRVTNITRSAKKDYYTLHVPGCEHYFANGVMHHNSGKTFVICYGIATRAIMAPGSRHAIFRRHGVAVKQSIGRDTMPKVFDLAYPGIKPKPKWHEQDGYFLMPNKSEIWLAGLDDKDRVDKVLGKEFASLYFNEASEIPFNSYLVAQTRLAQNVMRTDGAMLRLRSYVDLNPTVMQHWTYQLYVAGQMPGSNAPVDLSDYWNDVANPEDNAANLPPDYIASLRALPSAMRKRFYEGKYGSDSADALWRRHQIVQASLPGSLSRIVVAIDPAASSDPGSDETGIVCVGIGADQRGYVLADESGRYRPEEWARKAIALYDTFRADRIVAEVNNGGEMVEAVIRAQRPDVSYRGIHASRGKVTRAEPIAALYELGKISHCGEFAELETQMCGFTIDFDRKLQGYSPDRVDALVWACADLFPEMTQRRATDLSGFRPPSFTMV